MSEESTPRVGVFICDCGKQIAGRIDTQTLAQKAGELPGVVYAARDGYPCSKDGQARICQAIAEHDLDRVVIAGCSPRLTEKLFRKTMSEAGLDASYLHIANIREQVVYVHPEEHEERLRKSQALIDMGVARLMATHAAPVHSGRVVKAALVIGSGLSALTVALGVADNGLRIFLVEKSKSLGEAVPDLQERTRQLTAEKSKSVLAHPMIDTFLNAHITEISGHPGDYTVKIQHGEQTTTIGVGSIVVANSARPKDLGTTRWFDREKIKTQAEFEHELEETGHPFTLQDIVMILCAEPSQRERCSRVCCSTGIHQAIQAKKRNPNANITVLFRDLYLGGIGETYENALVEARTLGVTFFRYRKEAPPVIGNKTIDILDTLTGEPVRVPFDRAVLSMPLVPLDTAHNLAALLGLPEDEAGFLAEPRMRLRPGRYADPGIYVLGSAQQPADTAEALFQAYLVSARTVRFLNQEEISVDTAVAEIDASLCTGCGNCAQVCPTYAIQLEKRDGVLSLSDVDSLRCIGCGNCVVVCPVKAISLPGWDNMEIPAQITAALQSQDGEAQPGATPQTKILALACDWSAYAAADMAGSRKLSYPACVRILRMNCSARFDPYHILWAFLNGADGVFLGACPPGECHYGVGNLYARERVEVLKKELAQHGIDPRRLHLEFLAVDDGQKLVKSLADFVSEVQTEVKQPVR